MITGNDFADWPVIARYTRAQAIADSVFHDVTEQASQFGFRIPVAVTHTVWAQWIEATEELQEYGQSTEARLQDLLMVLLFRIRRLPHGASSSRVIFRVKFLLDAETNRYETPELIAVCGPGDDAFPVITVMVPEDE